MRLAIVSSYDEECGAAFYSSRLKVHLESAGHSVEVLRLPISLLRHVTPRAVVRKGNEEIKAIARRAAEFDAVLIQFEPGLYGASGWIRYARALTIIIAAKKVILTVHGFDRVGSRVGFVGMMREIASGSFSFQRFAIRGYLSYMQTRSKPFWKGIARLQHVSVLTFCKADRIMLERFYNLRRIDDFPITYFSQNQVRGYRASHSRDEVLRRYGLDPSRKYVAIAGFFGRYKGFLTAMKALEYLPPEYHLVIVGGEHPHGMETERDVGGYLGQMLGFALHVPTASEKAAAQRDAAAGGLSAVDTRENLINISLKKKPRGELLEEQMFEQSDLRYFMPRAALRDRIHFVGQVADEEMPALYVALDCFVHPYMKTQTGQSGSGPATFALEFGTNALFSNAPVFREMAKYFNGAMMFFNVGNFIELAQAVQRLSNFAQPLQERRNVAIERYNPEAMVAKYEQMLDNLTER
jgi:glycosyltransferase involved in cell wall biosynthesis